MTSNYPNALDDNTSLMPIPGNRQTYTLDMSMEIDDLEFRVDRLITGVTAPVYLAFQGGEIVLATSYNENVFYMTNITGRGALGSRIQPHRVGEGVVIGMFSVHLNQIKRGLESSQLHQGFVGLDTDKSSFQNQV